MNAGWVLLYTSLIMMILRFCAAPVVKALTPLGGLIASCVLATVGLVALSKATGLAILAAAALYGIGKTDLWPTMLGVVATTAIFPAMMLAGYVGLFLVFRTRGGYQAVALNSAAATGPRLANPDSP